MKTEGINTWSTLLLMIALKSKYSGNTVKDIQDLLNKNYITLLREVGEDLHKWKDMLTGRTNIIKMSHYSSST